jgi:antitoxin ParD1/3/4
MNISLTPELEEFITRKVQTGMYQTASEVVREGLRLLHERDELQQNKLDELRKAIAEGIEQANQGNVTPLTEETIQRVKDRGRGRRTQNGSRKA